MLSKLGRSLRKHSKRPYEALPDPRAVVNIRTINGISLTSREIPLTSPELHDRLKRLRDETWAPPRRDLNEDISITPFEDPDLDILGWASPPLVACYVDELGAVVEEEPTPEDPSARADIPPDENHHVPSAIKVQLRTLALEVQTSLEAPELPAPVCANSLCQNAGQYRCDDCDAGDTYCQGCTVSTHYGLPFHRIRLWNGTHFAADCLANLGLVLGMNHGGGTCPYAWTDGGPQDLTVLDVNGIHRVLIGWCRCASAPSHAEQLLTRRIFPATFERPVTGFTFRAMKLFQMLNHVGHLTPWDFCGAQHRLTDNVDPGSIRDLYKQFNQAQRQWRPVRAWRRGGVVDADAPREPGSLVMPCVSCPNPNINLPSNWENDPDADLIYASYVGGDGNFRLSRDNKGGGEVSDLSLFGDDAFYAPNEAYKEFCSVRAGAPDDQSDITCRGLRAGNPARVTQSHNKPCTGILCVSCIRSGAFFSQGTVDLAINMGLNMELRQQNLRAKIKEYIHPTAAQDQDLVERRRKMSKALDAWYATLADFMPLDALEYPLDSAASPEKEVLRLPSDFPRASLDCLGLRYLASTEIRLRIGQAHDALKKLRNNLGLKSFLTRRKYALAGGQGVLTRAERHVQRAGNQVNKWKEVYQRSWRALEHLRGETPIPASEESWLQLRELHDDNCVMLSRWMEEHQYWGAQGEMKEARAADKGRGHRDLPWIWKMQFNFTDKGADSVKNAIEDWTVEVIRLEWLHARASMERFSEEVRLLRAESLRVGKTFRHYEETWSSRAISWQRQVDGGSRNRFWRGACAGAHRRAAVFRRLAVGAEDRCAQILASDIAG